MENTRHNSSQPPLEEILWEVVQHYIDRVPSPPWLNEKRRWQELIVCVLSTSGEEGSQQSRRAVEILAELNLLHIPDLAALPWVEGALELEHPHTALMSRVMGRLGFSTSMISTALERIAKLAQDVHSQHQDHIQVYLRQQGRRMLAELPRDFPSLFADDVPLQNAFALWLQNVLTMPIFLDTPNSVRFCEATGYTLQQLHEAADKLDISASLLDDLIDLWAADRELWQQ